MELKKYLDDLAGRINDNVENDLRENWVKFLKGNFSGQYFKPVRNKKIPPEVEWPEVSINEALEDYDKMALQQFNGCSELLKNGSGNFMAVRCNYGTSIIPSLFDVELFIMDEKLDTLPTSKPLSGGKEDVKKLVEKGIPDINKNLGEKVLAMGEYFQDLINEYTEFKKHVFLYHPDLQGPMDICEVIWGSSLFLDINDEPQLVHDFLEIITQTYINFMKAWEEIVPFNDQYNVHWGLLHQGNIMLRDDSAMNFSPEMFNEFIRPYDQRLLNELEGGAIHFCGKGDHYIESLSEMDKVYAINMSQPEYNNMETIYKNTVDKGIKIIGFHQETAEKAVAGGRDLKGEVQC
ncbi:MAG: hypothetical protein ACOC4G_08475 [Bacillota bacterium]